MATAISNFFTISSEYIRSTTKYKAVVRNLLRPRQPLIFMTRYTDDHARIIISAAWRQ